MVTTGAQRAPPGDTKCPPVAPFGHLGGLLQITNNMVVKLPTYLCCQITNTCLQMTNNRKFIYFMFIRMCQARDYDYAFQINH